MIKTSVAALAALCSFAAAVAAQEAVQVEKIFSGPEGRVAVFNEKGVDQGELPKDAFKTLPLDAIAYNRNTGFVKVMAGEKEVWLSPFQVEVSVKAQVLTPCEAAKRVADPAYSARGAQDCPAR